MSQWDSESLWARLQNLTDSTMTAHLFSTFYVTQFQLIFSRGSNVRLNDPFYHFDTLSSLTSEFSLLSLNKVAALHLYIHWENKQTVTEDTPL